MSVSRDPGVSGGARRRRAPNVEVDKVRRRKRCGHVSVAGWEPLWLMRKYECERDQEMNGVFDREKVFRFFDMQLW